MEENKSKQIEITDTQKVTIDAAILNCITTFTEDMNEQNGGYVAYIFKKILYIKNKVEDKKKINEWNKFKSEEVTPKISYYTDTLDLIDRIANFALKNDHDFINQMSEKKVHDNSAKESDVKEVIGNYIADFATIKMNDFIAQVKQEENMAKQEKLLKEFADKEENMKNMMDKMNAMLGGMNPPKASSSFNKQIPSTNVKPSSSLNIGKNTKNTATGVNKFS